MVKLRWLFGCVDQVDQVIRPNFLKALLMLPLLTGIITITRYLFITVHHCCYHYRCCQVVSGRIHRRGFSSGYRLQKSHCVVNFASNVFTLPREPLNIVSDALIKTCELVKIENTKDTRKK